MLKIEFLTKEELDIYVSEQIIRKEKGYLTRSERETLQKIKDNPKNYIHEVKDIKKGKPIVTSLVELKKSCQLITKEDDIQTIINDLRETLNYVGGYGLTANQIGIQKKISICKIPNYNPQTKKVDVKELVLINAKIIEKDRYWINKQEGCLSIPHIRIDTDRWVFITVEYLDEKLQPQILPTQDIEALIIQHEYDHQIGLTILDRKHHRR